MKNLIIQYKQLPKTMLGFFTKINDNEYIVLNDKIEKHFQILAYLGCMYYKEQNLIVGKITIEDIEKDNFEPIQYAKNRIKMILGE